MTQIIDSLADIANRYDVLLVDLWGCVHNGVTAYPEAVASLRGFRQGGGTVVLLTNAPRSRHEVAKQLVRLNVPEDSHDDIATSGDSARAAMFRGAVGEKVWFMGQPFDETFFDPMDIIDDPVTIQRVDLVDAEGIICCVPFDPHADPAVNRPQFLYAKQKGLKLLCANPDIVVDRGDSREWCAGALAALYTEMGGESLYFGKPHPPVYDLARRRLAQAGTPVSETRILCIGDGIATDIAGALGEGLDAVFVTGGLAAAEIGPPEAPDPARLEAFLGRHQMSASFAMGRLR